jgi:membrane protein
MAPVSVLMVWIGAIAWESGSVRQQIIERLTDSAGPGAAAVVESVLTDASIPGGDALLPTLIALAIFIFSATAVFGQLQGALRDVWEIPATPGHRVVGFLRRRLLALVLVSALALVLVVSMAVRVAMTALADSLPSSIPFPMVTIADVGVSALTLIVLFTLVFRILPDADVPWPEAALGGLVTGILFVVGQWVAGVYLGRTGIGSAYGAAGSLVVFLSWVYYSSLVFLFGAEVTRALSGAEGSHA